MKKSNVSLSSSLKIDDVMNTSYAGKIKISRAGSIKDEDGESSDLSESLCSENDVDDNLMKRSLSTRVAKLL